MTAPRIREVGDAALALEWDPVIDPRVNDRAVAAAAAVRRERLPGVRDVVSTYATVVVHCEPGVADLGAIRRALARASTVAAVESASRALIEVPVAYGGEHGPDLEALAAFAGLPASGVVDRHAGCEYRVYMLGFLPGFAYMGTVDASIAAPRRDTPRMHVAAGSVGVAGRQTGVYPVGSPGGWQIIGRTPLQVFDAARAAPALFAPGDRVRFVPEPWPASADESPGLPLQETHPADVASWITVVRPGLFTTVQDEGRWGWQSLGVPVSGAMDPVAHRAANALVGNTREAATLEVTIAGPELRIEARSLVAITGADLGPMLDDGSMPMNVPVQCRAGSVLRFGGRRTGGRAYVAFAGGIQARPVLGSRSTHTGTRMGGIGGRALRAGDRLGVGAQREPGAQGPADAFDSPGPRMRNGSPSLLRILPGPQENFFPASAVDVLLSTRYLVTPQSDRMGYRLAGPASIPRLADREMISGATVAGAIQVPPSGAPILLMADRQTTGGYPQIATVITADLPVAGQLVPGDWLQFRLCSRAEALAALSVQQERLRALE